jgi:hypothetical protein
VVRAAQIVPDIGRGDFFGDLLDNHNHCLPNPLEDVMALNTALGAEGLLIMVGGN